MRLLFASFFAVMLIIILTMFIPGIGTGQQAYFPLVSRLIYRGFSGWCQLP